ncbi:MAG: NAD(+) synthase [Clostridiales bacterium]|uniref:NAD(+) synthase n=1 Tax=Clostridium sp. N3C TaxID=1776758 RepID=UPI00092E12F3|nr:NAD(+) synthase [Clostridium sp. N3C]NLZ49151.1 NAD(+) synthase [Clostridiales bacterium]SCN22795.1 NH(3)-dependent NAD(+) synthetase [Clostridium sp. N3C]
MRKDFNAQKVTEDIISWIREYFDNQPGAKGAVIGISGGKDSTVVSRLLVEALGKDRVFGVLMPNGEQKDIKDSLKLVDFIGIPYKIVNIEKAYNGLIEAISEENLSEDAKINIAPRLRMTTLYAIAANMHYRVCGTGNKSEAFVGYTTKWGDGAYDFNPIGDLSTEEVMAVGDYLGLPYELVHKTPSDGLSGKSDEEKLGFTYKQVNDYMERGTCGDKEVDEKIRLKHEANLHKQTLPPKFKVK